MLNGGSDYNNDSYLIIGNRFVKSHYIPADSKRLNERVVHFQKLDERHQKAAVTLRLLFLFLSLHGRWFPVLSHSQFGVSAPVVPAQRRPGGSQGGGKMSPGQLEARLAGGWTLTDTVPLHTHAHAHGDGEATFYFGSSSCSFFQLTFALLQLPLMTSTSRCSCSSCSPPSSS